MNKTFQQKFTKRFEVKSGKAAVYLGNRITVDSNKLTVNIDQTQYIDELLGRGFRWQTATLYVAALVS